MRKSSAGFPAEGCAVQAGKCDRCGGELVIRKDDQPATILERLKVYHELTEPLKDYYKKTGKLVIVEGQEEVEDTKSLVRAALEA